VRTGPESPSAEQVAQLRGKLGSASVSFGIPSFNEGRGIVHTLESLGSALDRLEIPGCRLILSDSSATTETVDSAQEWARRRSIDLLVDRSERRRTSKEARNVIMNRAGSDLLVQMDADIVVPAESLYYMFLCLLKRPSGVALGSTAPDPHFVSTCYRASAWQLKAVHRYASLLPPDAVRAEAAFWGAWRSFYRDFRFAPGEGSPVDDVDLAKHLHNNQVPTRNCWRAVAFKVPAGTMRDFLLQTHRGYAATEVRHRSWLEIGAALIEGVSDPVGAALYARARVWAAYQQRNQPHEWTEHWEVEESTKRR
jgi:glycosyltransferase involved in cell wall biosynthesis